MAQKCVLSNFVYHTTAREQASGVSFILIDYLHNL